MTFMSLYFSRSTTLELSEPRQARFSFSSQTRAVLSKYGWDSVRLQKLLGLLNHVVLTVLTLAFIRKIRSIQKELLWFFSGGPRMLLIFGATLLSYVSGTPKIFRWPHHWGKRLGCLTFRHSITLLIEYCVSTQDVVKEAPSLVSDSIHTFFCNVTARSVTDITAF